MSTKGFALITGGSKGIGKCIAVELAKRKYNLILVARSEDELSELSETIAKTFNVKTDYLALDLSAGDAAVKVFDWCKSKHYHQIEILVNNAGYGLWGDFEKLNLSDQESLLNVNVNTLVKLTHLFLPVLKEGRQSYILNVSSTAAYQAVPTLALYAASKAFVLSFSRALKFELRKSAVSVSCLCPGPVNTNFIDRAGMQAIKATAQKVEMTPEVVADIAVRGMLNKETEIVPGFLNVFTAFMVRFVPKSLTETIAAGIYTKK